jgi:predicted nuclease with TOPRIM domain
LFLLQALLRAEYELVVQRTLAAENDRLTAKAEAQLAEIERLKVDLAGLPEMKAQLAKCEELKERLALAEKWRSRVRENLDVAGHSLEQASGLSTKICQEVARMLEEHDKLV